MTSSQKEDDCLAVSVEAYRDLITDGHIHHATNVCRRLIRTDNNLQRIETAHLVLDRLRSNRNDTNDDVNALLRLVANYVSPTREFTEEVLSLLFFCDHRVLLIHHLSKTSCLLMSGLCVSFSLQLTYQSKECVKLVVDAYLELLSSDRSLLVPILGSLADMPLDANEKNAVIDATQFLLDAAVEEDVPAVVQSLLSMLTPSSSSRIAGKVRAECNRIGSGTLCLTLEIGIKAATAVAQHGRIESRVMREVMNRLVLSEWNFLLSPFIRFCSFLLSVCFQDKTKPTLAPDLIANGVDGLTFLIEARTSVHEEALSLLLTLTSQPKKLLLLATSSSSQRNRGYLCWKVAEVVASNLAELARKQTKLLASYTHVFLDHLHAIASTANDSMARESYPSHILDLLCYTVVALTKQERGIYSLLMITIQKQLVFRAGIRGMAQSQHSFRLHNGNALSTVAIAQVKQLMAVFLAGHMLRSHVVVDQSDRKSLVNWILRLLSNAASDETLLHVMRFVRDGMSSLPTAFMRMSISAEEQALCNSLVSQVFRKKGLIWAGRDEILQRLKDDTEFILAFDDTERNGPQQSAVSDSLVVDIAEFVSKMRIGQLPMGRRMMAANVDETASEEKEIAMEKEIVMKISLLRELFYCNVAFSSPALQEKIIHASILFPLTYATVVLSGNSESEGPNALNKLVWNLICALDLAVAGVNTVARQYFAANASSQESFRYLTSVFQRLRVCFEIREQLERVLALQKYQIQEFFDNFDAERNNNENIENMMEWLYIQTTLAQRMMNGQLQRMEGNLPYGSLFGLDFTVVCLVFEYQWKKTTETTLPLAYELELLRVLHYHLKTNDVRSIKRDELVRVNDGRNSISTGGNARHMLVSRSEGRRTVKYLCGRATELSLSLNSGEFVRREELSDEFDGDSNGLEAVNALLQSLIVSSLHIIYNLIGVLLESGSVSGSGTRTDSWSGKLMELLAKGANPDIAMVRWDNPSMYREVFYRFLMRQCLDMTDARLVCSLIDTLIPLVLKRRKQSTLSQLCFALVHQTYPTITESGSLSQEAEAMQISVESLPLAALPHAVVAPRGGKLSSLAKYRCMVPKWRFLVYLLVGSWSFSPSTSAGIAILTYFLDAMHTLVKSSVSEEKIVKKKRQHGKFDSGDEEDFQLPSEAPTAVNGEHRILKSLTTETFPYYLETILMCAIASLFRAGPKSTSGPMAAPDFNPFEEYCDVLDVIRKCLKVFVRAENSGFNVPFKTNISILRGCSFLLRSTRSVLQKCMAWRIEQGSNDELGALRHLQSLFDGTQMLLVTMESVRASFQERVVLKMQRNMPKNGVTSTNASRKHWQNDLLAKAYGKRYRQRRWISKSEAKLLPYFSHGIQELSDFIQSQRTVNNIFSVKRNVQEKPTKHRQQFKYQELTDELLSAVESGSIEFSAAILNEWNFLSPSDLDDEDDDGDDENIQDDDGTEDENLSEDEEDDGIDGFVVQSHNGSAKLAANNRQDNLLQSNEDLGFASIVVNYKKHKRT